jgi:hypothetical protein
MRMHQEAEDILFLLKIPCHFINITRGYTQDGMSQNDYFRGI